jgi:hypothetical protein
MPFEADKPIPKQLFFELEGRRHLRNIGYEGLFEQVKTWPHYDEVYQSWTTAVSKLNVGTPKLKGDFPEETEELEKFFIQLRVGDFVQTLKQYSSLIERREYDKDFRHWFGKIIQLRDNPSQAQLSLRYYILLFWRHGFLWTIDPLDRANVIFRAFAFAVPIKPVSSEAVRKAATRMGLKSCSNFHRFYPQAPIKLVLEGRKREESFYFDFPLPGQQFPLPKED